MRPVGLGVLVVLFKPTRQQLDHVAALARSWAPVVVVDNSPCPDHDTRSRLEACGAAVLANANQGGIGGAFNVGMRHMCRRDVSAVVLLDQDSVLPPGFFEAITRACDNMRSADYIVAPRIFDIHAGRCIPAFTFMRTRLRTRRVDACASETMLACNFLVSSGSAVSIAAYERVGPFREDYVVDHVDSDYCLRAFASGVSLAMTCLTTMQHSIGRATVHRLFGLPLLATNHPASRRYYFARNAVDLTRRHARRLPSVAVVNLLTLYQGVAVLLFERDKLDKIVATLAGLVDGLRGRTGPIGDCRPRLASRLAAARHD